MRYKYTKRQPREGGETKVGVIYVRVSSEEQKLDGFSIPAQRRLLTEYAEKLGIEVLETFEDVETAKRSGRKNFNRMLDFLATHPEVGHVLGEKTDRVYRNFQDKLMLESLGRKIHLVKEGDVITPQATAHERLVHGFKTLLAQHYVENLSEEVTKGMLEKARGGDFPTKLPMGYLRDPKSGKALPDPDRAPIIAKAFELCATGNYSLADIRKDMIARGFTMKSGKKPAKSSVEGIMKNPFYYGEMRWQGQLFQGNFQPLVSRKTFDRVQQVLSGNKPGIYQERKFAFGRFMTCAFCGCTITAEIKKEKYIYYRCTHGRGKCQTKSVSEAKLREQFCQVVADIRLSPQLAAWIEEAIAESGNEERVYHEQEVKRLREEVDRLEARMKKMYVDKLDGLVEEAFWVEKSAEWRKRIDEAQVYIQAHLAADKNYKELARTTLELAQSAHRLFIQQCADEQRRLLEHVLSNCYLRDGMVEPEYRKPFALLAYAAKHFDTKKGGSEVNSSKPPIRWR